MMSTDQIHIVTTDLVPFVYGTLGACVFLLRSLHEFIHQRTYDRRHKPEYLNRILLGTISGGIVWLLISQGNQNGSAPLVNSAAVGFVSGYNTDLLFSAIERITNAILPKVPPTPTLVAAPPAPPPPVTAPAGSAGGSAGGGTPPSGSPSGSVP